MWLGLILIWGLFILVFLAFEALRITGYGFCMGIAPTRKTQMLKGLAIAVFCLGLANLLLPTASCGGTWLMFRAEGWGLWFGGWGMGGLLVLAEFICFLLFLRGVAVALRKDALAQNLLIYTIVTPVYSLLVFALPVIALWARSGRSSAPPTWCPNVVEPGRRRRRGARRRRLHLHRRRVPDRPRSHHLVHDDAASGPRRH